VSLARDPAKEFNPLLLLAGIVLLGLVVRAAAMGSRLHNDDAYSWLVAMQPSPHAFLRQLAATENTPPLSYLLLSPLPIGDPTWLRVPAVAFGTLLCVAVYGGVRSLFGARAGLLAALGTAVSPFLITYSDLARGFMLEDLALLVSLTAAIRLTRIWTTRWAIVFVASAAVALYTEYSSVIFVLALTGALLWVGRPARLRTICLSGAALLTLMPWINQIVNGEHQVGLTKLHPHAATPSVTGLRDAIVTLALGESGGTQNGAGRWLIFAVILLAAAGVALALRSRWSEMTTAQRVAVQIIAATAALTLVGHAIAAVVGVDVFTQRYMTVLIPLAAILAALAISKINMRAITVLVGVALTVLGLAEVVRRWGAEYEPSFAAVRAVAVSIHPRTVLTDTPVVLYYLKGFRPIFDRPADLGPGLGASCARPCLIIDDTRGVGGTPRNAQGQERVIPPFLVTVEP